MRAQLRRPVRLPEQARHRLGTAGCREWAWRSRNRCGNIFRPLWFGSPYGEKIPDGRSEIYLDPAKKDAWGLPEVQRRLIWSDNDWKIFRDMQRWGQEIVRASGGEIQHVWGRAPAEP